jgi:hypothetical protein
MKTLFLSLFFASLVGIVPALVKKDTDPGQLKKIHQVPDTGSTLTLLGIGCVTLAAFGCRFRVNVKDGVK